MLTLLADYSFSCRHEKLGSLYVSVSVNVGLGVGGHGHLSDMLLFTLEIGTAQLHYRNHAETPHEKRNLVSVMA